MKAGLKEEIRRLFNLYFRRVFLFWFVGYVCFCFGKASKTEINVIVYNVEEKEGKEKKVTLDGSDNPVVVSITCGEAVDIQQRFVEGRR